MEIANKKNPHFSVIMPTYNRQDLIQDSLRSVLKQSRLPDEIIICDDGSTDATVSAARSILEPAAIPFRIIEIMNSGPSNARRVAVEASTSEWLVFLDSDDLWSEHHLESICEVIQDEGVECVVSNFRMATVDGVEVMPSKFDTAPAHFWRKETKSRDGRFIWGGKRLFTDAFEFTPCFPSALACSRAAYNKAGGITLASRELKSEDFHFIMKLYFFCKVCFCFPVNVTIVLHGDNRSMLNGRVDLIGKLRGRKGILQLLSEVDEVRRDCDDALWAEIRRSELELFNHMFWAGQYEDAVSQFRHVAAAQYERRTLARYGFACLKTGLRSMSTVWRVNRSGR